MEMTLKKPALVPVVQRSPGYWATVGKRLLRNKLAMLAALILLGCYAYAFAVYWVFERNTQRVRGLLGRPALPAAQRGQNI